MDDIQTPLPPDETSTPAPVIQPEELLRIVDSLQHELDGLRAIVSGIHEPIPLPSRTRMSVAPMIIDREGAKIIEGTFEGQNMTAPDGKQYSVPANYASKSKLVEGDVLKLTITRDGSFIYKQIGPIDRRRVVGTLARDEMTGEYRVVADEQTYKVLLASITYFKGEPGDEVVVLLPQDKEARWGAVENIMKPGTAGPAPAVGIL